MRLKDIGEDKLIELIKEQCHTEDKSVLCGVGDDTAVTRTDGNTCLLSTTDTLNEGIHFNLSKHPPLELGKKAISVSLSDIASMGGVPRFCLVSITAKKTTTTKFIEELYHGLNMRAKEFGVSIIGGNTSTGEYFSVTTTLLGEAKEEVVLYRSGARIGDILYVSGTLGDSALGLKLLTSKENSDNQLSSAIKKHLDPEPRVGLGRILGERKIPSSMTDVSDGLIKDAGHIAIASNVWVNINSDNLPFSKEAKKHPKDKELLILGGEDYELLFTAPPEKDFEITKISKELNLQITAIGDIIENSTVKTNNPEPVTITNKNGINLKIELEGYEHFITK
ncbi:MAG: thiamine-phosphate kinase [Deltaproteobacteria bacterium]|nr:thiamine-phosphate kinase [Deltaproteobacteria bacterium]